MKKLALVCMAASCLTLSMACSSESGRTEKPGTTGGTPVASVTPAVLERGKALYKANCAACHGESGKGDGPGAGVLKPPPRDHTDKAFMSTLTDKQIWDVIKMGGAMRGKPLMPSHPQFKDDDLHALVAYVRSLSSGT